MMASQTDFSSMSTLHIRTFLYQNIYFLPVLALITYIIYFRFLHPLSRIPGPLLASLSHWYLVYYTLTGSFHRHILDLHTQYGPIVRIAPNEISVSSSSSMRQVYGPNSGARFRKSDWYTVFQGKDRRFDLIAGLDEKTHGRQRKLVARAYTMETLRDLEPYVDECIEVFKGKMTESAIRGQTVDMANWLQLFAFDVVGAVTWSASFNFMHTTHDDGTFSIITRLARSASWLGHVTYIHRLHELLKPVIGNWLAINLRHGPLRDFALRESARRKENPGGKRDMISRFFETHEKSPEEFTYADVVSMATSNINAGSDTTAISMRAILYHLLKNPVYKTRLIAEIDDYRRRGQLSNPVKFNEGMEMKYLQAVIYEAIRVFPPVGINLPRVVPPGGVEMDGYYIPEGTVVGANAWAVHRNKEIFGQDADKFRPERWLASDTGDMSRFFFSFGGGSRACIGRNVAWLEISKLIPTLFLDYDIELADPSKESPEKCFFFVHQQSLDINLKLRQDLASSE